MSGSSGIRAGLGALLFGCLMAAAVPSTPAAAQIYVGTGGEDPADALARNLKILAQKPRDFQALVTAGRAALDIGDTQAAAGFFGRAEEVNSSSPLPQIGKGAALAMEGDANGALQFFARAVQLGATPAMVGLDRGLAYDLLGYHQQAQTDYRAAMAGPDSDEARRRLALSLGIVGRKDEALQLLGPLMARGDAAAARCRAFILALNNDLAGARVSIDAAMPGSSQQMAYFLHKLPTLRTDQKAAAVHLGLFPDSSQLAAAGTAAPGQPALVPQGPVSPSTDRLASIDELLGRGRPSGQPLRPASPWEQLRPETPQRVASAAPQPAARTAPQPAQQTRPAPASARTSAAAAASSAASGNGTATLALSQRYWVQLASGKNAEALPGQFERIKRRHSQALEGIGGYVAEEDGRARLLIGPFKDQGDARLFASDLSRINVNAFSWTSEPGQLIRKLPSQ